MPSLSPAFLFAVWTTSMAIALIIICILAMPLVLHQQIGGLVLWARRSKVIRWTPEATVKAIRRVRKAMSVLLVLEGLVVVVSVAIELSDIMDENIHDAQSEFVYRIQQEGQNTTIYPDFRSCMRGQKSFSMKREICKEDSSVLGCVGELPNAVDGQKMKALKRQIHSSDIGCVRVRLEDGEEGWIKYRLPRKKGRDWSWKGSRVGSGNAGEGQSGTEEK